MKVQAPNRALLATDQSRSVLRKHTETGHRNIAYCPFGNHRYSSPGALPAFNGQAYEQAIHGYLLGNGYRVFDPALRRFHSPDSFSPFGRGGINPYVYCVGDPISNTDPTGHLSMPKWLRSVLSFFGYRKKPSTDIPLSVISTPPSANPHILAPQRSGSIESIHVAQLPTQAQGRSNYSRNPNAWVASDLRKLQKSNRVAMQSPGASITIDPLSGNVINAPTPNFAEAQRLTRMLADFNYLDEQMAAFERRLQTGPIGGLRSSTAIGGQNSPVAVHHKVDTATIRRQ